MDPPSLEKQVLDTWDFSDPAASEALIRSRVAEASTANERAVWLTQAARARGLIGDFAGARQLLDQAEGESEPAASPHVRARVAIERGRVANSAGNPVDAVDLFDRAFNAAQGAQLDGLAVDALHMIAIAVGQTAGPVASAAANRRALILAEGSTDPAARRWRASVLNNLGWDLHAVADFDEALEVFTRALQLRREAGDDAQRLVAEWSVARTLRSLGRYDDALAIQRRLGQEPNGSDDGYVYEEIGECLLALGRDDEARPELLRAYELLSSDTDLVEAEPERLARLGALSAPTD